MPMFIRKFEPSRAVEVIAPKYGSGYRIGGGLVLTAAHLLDNYSECKVRDKRSFGEGKAQVVWKDPDLDIALIELLGGISPVEVITLGKLPQATAGEKLVFQMYAYPLWARTKRKQGSAAEGRQIEGIIYLSDTSSDKLLVLEPERLPPEATTAKSEWEGASGAAIICDGLLIAVQSRHQNPSRPASLAASPLLTIYPHKQWRQLLEKHGINPEPEIARLPAAERDPENLKAPTSNQVILIKLQVELDCRKSNSEGIYKPSISEKNDATKNNMKRKLEDPEEKTKNIKQNIDQSKQTEITSHPLVKILSPNADSTITCIKRAYQSCCSETVFNAVPDTVEDLLKILQDIPTFGAEFTPIDRFLAHLVLDSDLPIPLVEHLRKWGSENIKQFDKLLDDTRRTFIEKTQSSDSYLLVKIKPSQQRANSNHFQISAWFIPTLKKYQPEKYQGYYKLDASNSSDDTFTIKQLPDILNLLLTQIQNKDHFLTHLTIEFFLPRKLLNYAVDKLEEKEGLFGKIIGRKYRVTVRAYERLEKTYRVKYEVRWREKWERLQQIGECKDLFLFPESNDLKNIFISLDDKPGLILTKIPEKTKEGDIFSVLLETATPVAIWLRQELKVETNQNKDFTDILTCSILELPESVRKIRLQALNNGEDDVGNHLSLLWEDPDRLTPDAEYFYSQPQSVS